MTRKRLQINNVEARTNPFELAPFILVIEFYNDQIDRYNRILRRSSLVP
jgi:hypothetical protein